MNSENNTNEFSKLPRLYVLGELQKNKLFPLAEAQAHYLRAVIRRQPGDKIRVFNGQNGEWLASLAELGKKKASAEAIEQIRPQPLAISPVHLYFAPIKKNRLGWLIEKAVELGATHLHPVITQNTETRQLKEERINSQIIEAAEQCERMDLPVLLPPVLLPQLLETQRTYPLWACLERDDTAPLMAQAAHRQPETPAGILIGPEGGFTKEEAALIRQAPNVMAVSLGPRILRAETAVCAGLSLITLCH